MNNIAPFSPLILPCKILYIQGFTIELSAVCLYRLYGKLDTLLHLYYYELLKLFVTHFDMRITFTHIAGTLNVSADHYHDLTYLPSFN